MRCEAMFLILILIIEELGQREAILTIFLLLKKKDKKNNFYTVSKCNELSFEWYEVEHCMICYIIFINV